MWKVMYQGVVLAAFMTEEAAEVEKAHRHEAHQYPLDGLEVEQEKPR